MTRFKTTPDVHYGEIENFVGGETGISKWRLTGTTPTGEKACVRGCDFHTVREGKVARKNSCWKNVA